MDEHNNVDGCSTAWQPPRTQIFPPPVINTAHRELSAQYGRVLELVYCIVCPRGVGLATSTISSYPAHHASQLTVFYPRLLGTYALTYLLVECALLG